VKYTALIQKPCMWLGNTASRNKQEFRRVSCEVQPVRRPTASGGKKTLHREMVRRLARGMRIARWGWMRVGASIDKEW